MYVYKQVEFTTNETGGLWTVGFYDPHGNWHPESDHKSAELAAERVAYLNGANVSFAE